MTDEIKPGDKSGDAQPAGGVTPAEVGQPQIRTRLDARVVSFAHWVIRRRWLIIPLTIVIAVGAAAGGQRLTFSTDYRIFFSSENPQLQAFETFENIYTRDDSLNFVIKPASGDVFTPALLASIRDLTEASWLIPFTTRVDSITNYQHTFAEGDDLTVQDLVLDATRLSDEDISSIREIALAEPLIAGRLVSTDGTTTSVNVIVNRPQKGSDELPRIMSAAQELVAVFQTEHPEARIALTGGLVLSNAFIESGMRDMATLVPLMYGILLLVMIVLLRSASATIATVLVIGFSAATAMGIAGWLGIQLTSISAVAPTIILTLAVADSIHILVTIVKEMRRGVSKRDAIVESLRINFGPVFLTSLTTIIGFLSLNFSDAPPFGHLGNITAIGVAAAWLSSIFFLPAAIAVLPLRVKVTSKQPRFGMDRFADFVVARRKLLFIVVGTAAIAVIATTPRIELNDQFVRYFAESTEFRSDADFANENLAGIYAVNWSLPADSSGGINEPEYLERLDRFSNWLRDQPEVTHGTSLADVYRRLNKNMHGDDPSYYRLPEERNLAAQYLLLYEMSLPYGLDLNNQINVDKSATRLVAMMTDLTTVQLRGIEARAGEWLATNFPSAAEVKGTSAFIMFAYISERNITRMLTGTLIAFGLISLSILIALRSVKLGLISLVPNLIPVGIAFGIWSIFVGEIGLAAAGVAATSLGIIVDATVHFLSKYMRARRERRESPADAVRYAFSTVGTALWVVAAILIAGFAVLSFSTFKVNSNLGQLTAIAIAAALLADFLLLPALLMVVDRSRFAGPRRETDEASLPVSEQAVIAQESESD